MLELELQYRAAERGRQESRAMLDAVREGMVLIAPDRRLLTLNQRFGEIFDIRLDQAVGYWLDELLPKITRMFSEPGQLIERLTGALQDVDQRFTDIVVQCWPHQCEFELFSSPVRDADGEYIGRLFVLRDVTSEREAVRLKSEFVSLVSHELRAPLTAIKGFADVLLAGEVGTLSGPQHEFMSIIQSNAERLVTLVAELLDIARIESGKIALRRAPLDLANLIRNAADAFQLLVAAKQQLLILELDAALPPVSGDADRMMQVVTNLLSNAHKYTDLGGTIRVIAQAQLGWVRIDIEDNGIGITPEDQAQLFTRFFRVQNHMAEDVGGTGLGLAICRLLVELHGGKIEVSSVFGHGSTFSVLLPADEVRVES